MAQLDDIIAGHGYDPRSTPIDTLMAGPVQMHLDVAEAMTAEDDCVQYDDTYGDD